MKGSLILNNSIQEHLVVLEVNVQTNNSGYNEFWIKIDLLEIVNFIFFS